LSDKAEQAGVDIYLCIYTESGGNGGTGPLPLSDVRPTHMANRKPKTKNSLTQCRDKFAHHSLIQTVSHSRLRLKIKAGLIGLSAEYIYPEENLR